MLSLILVASLATPTEPTWLGPKPGRVERIVSLAPSITELLFALGAGDRVVGVTQFDDFPPRVLALPRVGTYIQPDVEAVLALPRRSVVWRSERDMVTPPRIIQAMLMIPKTRMTAMIRRMGRMTPPHEHCTCVLLTWEEDHSSEWHQPGDRVKKRRHTRAKVVQTRHGR